MMHFQGVSPVLERVVHALGRGGELPRLADRDQTGAEPQGDGRTEDESPGLDADDPRDPRPGVRGRHQLHGAVEQPGVEQDGRDVLETDPRLREVPHLPNRALQVIE